MDWERVKMDLDAVKRYLEKEVGTSSEVDGLPPRFLEPLIMNSLKVDLIEPGRILCSMKIPQRLLVRALAHTFFFFHFYFFSF